MHTRHSRTSSADITIFTALKRCPPKDPTPSPLRTVTPTFSPPDPRSAWPFAGKTEARIGGTDFPRSRTRFETGPDRGAGETSPPSLGAGRGAGEGKVSPRQRLGCCYGAGPWEGGIPSNPSHPSLPHPPGNLNPSFSRAASTGETGYKKSSSLPNPALQTTGTNKNNNIIKVASTQPSLGAGFGWQRGPRSGGAPGGDPIPAAPHGARAPSNRPVFFRVSPPLQGSLWRAQGHRRPQQGRSRSPPRSLPLPRQAPGRGGPPTPGGGLTGFRGVSVDGISGDIHFFHPCVLPAGQSPHGRAGAQRAGCGGVPSRPGPAPAPGLAAAAAAPTRSILRSAPRPAPPPR